MSVAACPDCARPLLPGAPAGLCTACLLRLGEGESAPEATREAADLGGGVPAPAEQPGDRIGRYRLLEAIGEGGWGVVYVAEQEAPVRRRVALKVIKHQ